jgi:hypothetical protein
MGKLSDTHNAAPRYCKFGEIVAQHFDDDDLATLKDPAATSAWIAKTVSLHYTPISADVVRRHRSNDCACTRG